MLIAALLPLLAVPAAHAEEPTPIVSLCDDTFDAAIAGLGDAAGLVMFVATEYTLSQRQLEVVKPLTAQWPADEVKFFTVEVNRCSGVVVSQQISRVPAAVLYQHGAKLGELSSLSEPISDAQLTELVSRMR